MNVASFEDRLLGQLVEQHGALLADAPAPVAPGEHVFSGASRRRRFAPAAALAVALAAALAAIVVGLGSGSRTSPAFAVVRNADGTVSVTIAELAGVEGADDRLAALGVPARVVRSQRSCPTRPGQFKAARLSAAQALAISRLAGPAGTAAVVIDPAAVPAGDEVVIGARSLPQPSGSAAVGLETQVYEGAAPPCLPVG
jgi:hypothetical protein